MNLDFPMILVAATLVTGLVWAADALLWAPRRRQQAAALGAAGGQVDRGELEAVLKEPTLVEYSKSFFPVILAVLLGRGANWLLNPRYGLRVRTLAPLDTRVERVARAAGVETAAARDRVLEEDRSLSGCIRSAFGRDIDDPLGYDLVLNLGDLGQDAAGAAVAAALREKLQEAGGG